MRRERRHATRVPSTPNRGPSEHDGPAGPRLAGSLQRAVGNAAVTRVIVSTRPIVAVQRQSEAPAAGGRGPRIVAGNGTTAELQAERDRLRTERDALHISTIEPQSEMKHNQYTAAIRRLDVLLAERGNSRLPDAGVDLTFDGSHLSMSTGPSWSAVSGRPDASGRFDYSPARQRLENVGPIPAGVYWLDARQLVDLSDRWLYSWRYEDAWGTHRITIHPFDSTRTFGRGGFFIHGGGTPGSAGCIDLTSGMASFARRLGTLPRGAKVKLHVRY